MTMVIERFAYSSLFLLFVFHVNCAIPVMPTGGPVDSEPPVILEANPTSESVNVSTQSVRLVFSEYIDQASLVQALSVTPEFDTPLTYRWRKKRVDITFPEPLRDNTTYILTLDNNLRDANRVALKEPITIAFATGPTINRGRINGKVVQDLDGKGVADLDIYAYALGDSVLQTMPEKPDYRTQTGEDGSFKFDFMSEQSYFVVGLRDGNRNRRPDANELFAVPPSYSILADSSTAASGTPWFVTTLDTLPPDIQRVRSLSKSRHNVRFSESVQLLDRSPESWAIQDSTTRESKPVRDIYLYPEDPRLIYLITDSLSNTPHSLIPQNIADSSGNLIGMDTLWFTPIPNSDTLQTRFLGFYPQGNSRTADGSIQLRANQLPGIRFNQPVTQDALSSFVTARDSSGNSYSFQSNSKDGSIFSLSLESTYPESSPLQITVSGSMVNLPDTSFSETYAFLTTENMGDISGVVQALDSTGVPVVELFNNELDNTKIQALPDTSGYFIFTGLADKTRYNLRVFLDVNDNQQWDGGQIIPYIPAEAITWYTDSLQVRARWEQSLSDTLQIPEE